jgi:hypothetical protein
VGDIASLTYGLDLTHGLAAPTPKGLDIHRGPIFREILSAKLHTDNTEFWGSMKAYTEILVSQCAVLNPTER